MNVYGTQKPYEPYGFPGTEIKEEQKNPNEVNEDDFLTLLMAQLKYQDPTSPLDNDEFLSQLAQFRQMESMEKMQMGIDDLLKSMTISRASSLVGRRVTGYDEDNLVTGIVTKATIANDQMKLTVNEYNENGELESTHQVDLNSIINIEL